MVRFYEHSRVQGTIKKVEGRRPRVCRTLAYVNEAGNLPTSESQNKSVESNISNITNMSLPTSFKILFPTILGESPFVSGTIPHVFCDVDGVLANFYEGLYRKMGVPRSQVNNFLHNKNGWSTIAKKVPHLFATLSLLPDAKGLMTGLIQLRDKKHIKLSILTAIPNEWHSNPIMRKISTDDKIRWVRKFFPTIPAKNILVVRRDQKQLYAKAQRRIGRPNPVLIDDFIKNIREWEMAGGLGIHHTSSMDSLRQLSNYLN